MSVCLCLCLSVLGIALDYQLPFQGLVPADPSFEDMKRLVVVERRQLPIHEEWQKDVVSYDSCVMRVYRAFPLWLCIALCSGLLWVKFGGQNLQGFTGL